MIDQMLQYVTEPRQFFSARIQDDRSRFLPFLILIAAPLADLLNKAVVFYKIGRNNFKSQSDWSQIGGGYFGAIIGQQIAVFIKFFLLMVVIYLIARRLRSSIRLSSIMGLLGYCFWPSLVGSLLMAAIYERTLQIGAIELSVAGTAQIGLAMTSSAAYTWQRMVNINVEMWTTILVLSMMAACWRTRFIRTILLAAITVCSIEGTDILSGLLLRRIGVL
jgi:hypothetical protein